MSTEGFKFQASIKDAEGDMVNIRADQPEEFEAYLLSFPTAAYAQAKADVRGGASLGAIVQPQAPPAQQSPNAPAWGAQPQQQAPAPAWAGAPTGGVQNGSLHPENRACPTCRSVLVYKAGTSKAGKAYKLWACPNQRNRDDGHVTEFVD